MDQGFVNYSGEYAVTSHVEELVIAYASRPDRSMAFTVETAMFVDFSKELYGYLYELVVTIMRTTVCGGVLAIPNKQVRLCR